MCVVSKDESVECVAVLRERCVLFVCCCVRAGCVVCECCESVV